MPCHRSGASLSRSAGGLPLLRTVATHRPGPAGGRAGSAGPGRRGRGIRTMAQESLKDILR